MFKFIRGLGVQDRNIKKYENDVHKINALEESISTLSDEGLAAKTIEFKEKLAKGAKLNSLLHEAFATVREASKRTLKMRPFDVQLIGGMVLHDGKIAEMSTGEGKTLVATLPLYLNALQGKGAHLVTVNDYLANRDSQWMGQIYKFLGLSVGTIVSGISDEERKQAYAADITYGTNNEIGFDFLRDNLKLSLEEMVQREHAYAIVDEVDSILIDEARTPLIISGPSDDSSQLYVQIDRLIPRLNPEDYETDDKYKTVTLTEIGNEHIDVLLKKSSIIKTGSLFDAQNVHIVHHVNVALRAHLMYTLDKDYIISNGNIVIVDEFTGRTLEGRRYSEGLHQALEAREHLNVQLENQTLASITFQNLFRMYDKLGGMTGTAKTEASEFEEIYDLPVISIPTNKPIIREDYNDAVYLSKEAKERAVIELIKELHAKKQPILLGTISIAQSERFDTLLNKAGLKHNTLNARQHDKEALIIINAGKPSTITISTNMAGRGTDIQLGGNRDIAVKHAIKQAKGEEEANRIQKETLEKWEQDRKTVLDSGGLFVIGTERHESRRIDNQLRGRSGRQGDPGGSRFFVSLEDDLMRVFGSEKTKKMLTRFGLKPDERIEHKMISNAIERAQKRVENYNFETRKQLLKYDNVVNDQRKIIFDYRMQLLKNKKTLPTLENMQIDCIEDLIDSTTNDKRPMEDWDVDSLSMNVQRLVDPELDMHQWLKENEALHPERIESFLIERVKQRTKERIEIHGEELYIQVVNSIILQIIDQGWKDHLLQLDHLRESIGLRAYAQQDPLNEYKRESFTLFDTMLVNIADQVAQYANLLVIEASIPDELIPEPTSINVLENIPNQPAPFVNPIIEEKQGLRVGGGVSKTNPSTSPVKRLSNDIPKVSKNALCPCGSGKKYKNCHGKKKK